MGAFVLGAVVGSWVFLKTEYLGFILPLATSTIAVILSLRSHAGKHQRES
jgi:hypothetical protein